MRSSKGFFTAYSFNSQYALFPPQSFVMISPQLSENLQKRIIKKQRGIKTVNPKALTVNRKEMLVSLAAGFHLFPFRTESLSPPAPMVLGLISRESRSMPTQITQRLSHSRDRRFFYFIMATPKTFLRMLHNKA